MSVETATSGERDALTLALEVAPALAEDALRVDETSEFPVRSFERLRSTGLMGLAVPREFGGLGGDIETIHRVAKVLGGSCLSTGMVWAMHSQQVAVLVDHAPEKLKREVLPEVAAGRMFVASVTSERGKGGHLLTANAPLGWQGDSVVLQREAPVVTGGGRAEAYLMTMRRDEAALPSDVVLVFAHRKQLTTKQESGWSSLGMRGTESIGMHLNGTFSAEQVLSPAKGFKQIAASTLIPYGHLLWASCWLGAAEGAYRALIGTLSSPNGRKGYDLGSELLAERIARVRLDIDTAGAFIRDVLKEYAELRRRESVESDAFAAPGFNIRINGVKLQASEMLFSAVDRMVQIGGLRYGYLKNGRMPLERTFRDLRSAQLMYGNERLLVANGKLSLIDRRAYADGASVASER